jgi:outer membrane protein assembly factor BamB
MRNGYYPGSQLLKSWPSKGPDLVWKFEGVGSGYSSPAIVGDKIIVTGTLDSLSYVFCFNNLGKLIWKGLLGPDFKGEYPGIYSTPVITGDLGYVMSSLGVLYCFSTQSGQVSWSKDLIREFSGKMPIGGFLDNLVVDGDKVICAPGSMEKNVVALDRKTGKLIWQAQGVDVVDGYSSPILIEFQGKKQYIYQDKRTIVSLDPDTGSVLWRYQKSSETMVGTPLYRDGFLFTLDGEGSILLKFKSGNQAPEKVWSNPEFFPLQGDPVLIGNRLYGKAKGKKYLAVDWHSGSTIGSIPTSSMVVTSIASDGLVFAYDIDGKFALLNPVESGIQVASSFNVPGGTKYHCTHPVIQNGILYVRHDNSLFAYKISI